MGIEGGLTPVLDLSRISHLRFWVQVTTHSPLLCSNSVPLWCLCIVWLCLSVCVDLIFCVSGCHFELKLSVQRQFTETHTCYCRRLRSDSVAFEQIFLENLHIWFANKNLDQPSDWSQNHTAFFRPCKKGWHTWCLWYLCWCIWYFHHKKCEDFCLYSLRINFAQSKPFYVLCVKKYSTG